MVVSSSVTLNSIGNGFWTSSANSEPSLGVDKITSLSLFTILKSVKRYEPGSNSISSVRKLPLKSIRSKRSFSKMTSSLALITETIRVAGVSFSTPLLLLVEVLKRKET